MSEDGAVRRGVGDAGEDESICHLGVIEEGLVRLVNGASGDLAAARGAGAGAARVGKVESLFFGLVEDVHVFGAFDDGLGAVFDEGHGVAELGRRARDASDLRKNKM